MRLMRRPRCGLWSILRPRSVAGAIKWPPPMSTIVTFPGEATASTGWVGLELHRIRVKKCTFSASGSVSSAMLRANFSLPRSGLRRPHGGSSGGATVVRAASMQPPKDLTRLHATSFQFLPRGALVPSIHGAPQRWRRPHDWLGPLYGLPQQRVQDSARNCVSHRARSAHPYGQQRPRARGSARNCALSQVRSARLYGRPRLPGGGFARSCASHPGPLYRPCWRSGVAVPRS